MPGGSAAQQSFIPEPQPESPDETANLLAADKAKSAGDLRTAAANDNYQPYDKEPANDNAVEETGSVSPEENEPEQSYNYQQAQLDADQQAEIAVAIAANKQRNFQQIQRQINELESQLSEFEKDLLDFKSSSLGGLLSIFRPRINILIDALISELKKGANNLSDEAKVGYYTGLIVTITSLIGILTAFKFLAAVLDAAFIDRFSCLRIMLPTIETIIIPIILILISPIYIPVLAVIFIMGKIPLLKGTLTQNLVKLIEKLKKQKEAWQVQLEKVKKKVALRKQIKGLKNIQKQIKQAK